MAESQPFDWMHYEVPALVQERSSARRREMHVQEIKDRARMLRRFGHDAEFVVHRCLGNLYWAYELHGETALTPEEVREAVTQVYERPGRD
jgi:hypothetical protein